MRYIVYTIFVYTTVLDEESDQGKHASFDLAEPEAESLSWVSDRLWTNHERGHSCMEWLSTLRDGVLSGKEQSAILRDAPKRLYGLVDAQNWLPLEIHVPRSILSLYGALSGLYTEDCMTKNLPSNDINKDAQRLLAALKEAGVDLSNEPGTPGKLWRALAAGSREGLTTDFLSEIQARGEMVTEIDAARARFDATGNQNPADLGFLLLGLFCTSTSDSLEIADEILALLRAKKAGRAFPDAAPNATRNINPTRPAGPKAGQ